MLELFHSITSFYIHGFLCLHVQDKFGVHSIRESGAELTAAVYLQVSTVSQALIFVTRSRSWSFVERPGLLLLFAFVVAQLVRTNLV